MTQKLRAYRLVAEEESVGIQVRAEMYLACKDGRCLAEIPVSHGKPRSSSNSTGV